MAVLNISMTALKVIIADFLGWKRNTEGAGADWSTETIARLGEVINTAARKVYYPTVIGSGGESRQHQWSFLRHHTTLTTSEPYDTGTVTIVSTAVTLADGTFPSWAAYGDLVVDSEHYEVVTRGGDTSLTLSRAADCDAGTSYSLERFVYDLPTDFDSMRSDPVYHVDHAEGYRTLKRTSVEHIHRLRRDDGDETDYPQWYAVRPGEWATATGQRWEFLVWPTPVAEVVLEYEYGVQPSVTVATDTYFRGGPLLATALEEMCLAVAEMRYGDRSGSHAGIAREALLAAIDADADRMALPYLIGDHGGELSDPPTDYVLTPTITLNGEEM